LLNKANRLLSRGMGLPQAAFTPGLQALFHAAFGLLAPHRYGQPPEGVSGSPVLLCGEAVIGFLTLPLCWLAAMIVCPISAAHSARSG
jgi:hypothetical protein